MRARRSTLAIGVLSAWLGVAAHAAEPELAAQLIEQGQYWQARDNAQRAAEVWQKVLQLDANQVNALYGMGLIGVKQNKPQQAKQYLDRLQALSPQPWQANQLAQDIALAKPENKALLAEARRLVDAGERDRATDTFRKMFNGLTPQGTIGREYYNNLAFNEAAWPEARKGMERLLRETPDDSILALFYAKQLARHEDSRLEGIRQLARLSRKTDIGGDADESWRLALIWQGPPSPAQVSLFDDFLKSHPDDQQIRDLLAKGRQQVVVGQQPTVVGRGLQALEKGDLQEAEKAFQERLSSHPDDVDALGGMGVIRQQQNRLAEAEPLLARSVAKGGSSWKKALDSVRYWLLIQRGRDLQAGGQTAQAQDALAQALRLDPKSLDGRVAIADIQASAGQYEAATANYRQVLAVQPKQVPAIRGLVNVLAQTGHADEALRLLDQLTPAQQAEFGDQGRLRALRARQQASLAEQRNDIDGALAAMREAVKNDPDNVWTTFDLARLYVKAGQSKQARTTIDDFTRAHRDNVEALYASALLSVEMEQWQDALDTLRRIPDQRRTAAMNELASQVTLTIQVNHAAELVRTGQRQEALVLLDRVQPQAAGNPERTGTLASAYVDAGDTPRAMAMMQPLVTPPATPSVNTRLQYASILLRAGEDAQVYGLLTALQNQSMNAATRKQYDDLRFLYRVRQAERLRQGGDLAAAYDTLAPALAQRPTDTDAIAALARMFNAAGDNLRALALYQQLAQRNPRDANVLLGAADTAVQAHENAYALKLLDQFGKLDSSDPTTLTEAARIYRALGKTGEATGLLRKAVAIENGARQRTLAAQGNGFDPAINPFRTQRRLPGSDDMAAIPPPAETTLRPVAMAAPAAVDILPAPAMAQRQLQAQQLQQAQQAQQAPAYATPLGPVFSTATPVAAAPVQGGAYAQPGARVAAARTANATTNAPTTALPGAATATQRALLGLQAPSANGVAVDNLSPAQRALNDILQSRSAYVTQGVVVRGNASESGLSRMNDIEAPLEVNMPVGNDRVAVRITPVSLDAGSLTDEPASRFGGGGSSATGLGKQSASGVGVAVAYERPEDGAKADIGTTPRGFKYPNIVGGVSVEQSFPGSSTNRFAVNVSRRAVNDSITSFAGSTDPRIGRSWGGVTANGGRAEMSSDDAQTGVYAYGALHSLRGNNVESNTRVELGGGAYQYLTNAEDEKMTAGVSATIISYANNQNYYTYGHGGYFSPQAYLGLGVPVTWAKRSDKFTFQLKGSVGMQYFRQDAADYFPTDAALQAASGRQYAQQTKTGLGYSLEGNGEYRFAPRLFVGGALRLNNSSDFRELNVAMYLRYTLEDMQGSFLTLPVSPYRSPYSN
ncbi:BCSC C-terminal domain-containing protein [Herbaspirillum sp. AP02]|uniref:cellulose biosynthesis protein BcsC n=1 Tax=unclassified Herbaspirillum TaxID=2624150 RepID=UPI0015DAFA1C|nr:MULTISPECIES: cellulose biosynthesis protein BcsC [unclassified Herbaspirillum]MBG7619579.1 BCSC C-terminal domain-containing protein [Herbaspirillum sp. AP02]NZD69480.1 BCSC C-terminal domain-containing protein [Herbaspirillum sp. AP21]